MQNNTLQLRQIDRHTFSQRERETHTARRDTERKGDCRINIKSVAQLTLIFLVVEVESRAKALDKGLKCWDGEATCVLLESPIYFVCKTKVPSDQVFIIF